MRSPNLIGTMKRARTSTSGTVKMSSLAASSCRGTPSAASMSAQVPASKISKKRALKTMPAGSQWPHSTRSRRRCTKLATGFFEYGCAVARMKPRSAAIRERSSRIALRSMRATEQRPALLRPCQFGRGGAEPGDDQIGDLQVVLVHHQHVAVALDAERRQVKEFGSAAGRIDGVDRLIADLAALVAVGAGRAFGIVAEHH